MAFRHITAAFTVLLHQEENEGFVRRCSGCLLTPGDIEPPGDGVAIVVGTTQVANGTSVQVDAVGGKVKGLPVRAMEEVPVSWADVPKLS